MIVQCSYALFLINGTTTLHKILEWLLYKGPRINSSPQFETKQKDPSLFMRLESTK